MKLNWMYKQCEPNSIDSSDLNVLTKDTTAYKLRTSLLRNLDESNRKYRLFCDKRPKQTFCVSIEELSTIQRHWPYNLLLLSNNDHRHTHTKVNVSIWMTNCNYYFVLLSFVKNLTVIANRYGFVSIIWDGTIRFVWYARDSGFVAFVLLDRIE